MTALNSPLRYPGGKGILSKFLSGALTANKLVGGVYVEPFAGGAGAALNLLFDGDVRRVILNDIDPCIFAFWKSILSRKDDFVTRIRETPVTIEEWKRQREIYRNSARHSRIKVGFATFYMNRCNRSGVLVNGGPIGGLSQSGDWKLNARYNKDELIRRIETIYSRRPQIEIHNMDAIEFLENVVGSEKGTDNMLVFLDPPYYVKGSLLYLNHYGPQDHAQLARFLTRQVRPHWLMTYDDVSEIRDLYRECQCTPFHLPYSAHTRKKGCELLIHRPDFAVPSIPSIA